jgi:hypothetical protein
MLKRAVALTLHPKSDSRGTGSEASKTGANKVGRSGNLVFNLPRPTVHLENKSPALSTKLYWHLIPGFQCRKMVLCAVSTGLGDRAH